MGLKWRWQTPKNVQVVTNDVPLLFTIKTNKNKTKKRQLNSVRCCYQVLPHSFANVALDRLQPAWVGLDGRVGRADGWTLNAERDCNIYEWLFCLFFLYIPPPPPLFPRISAHAIIIGTALFFSSCNLCLSPSAPAAHRIHTAWCITAVPCSCKVAQDAESGRVCASSVTDLQSYEFASRDLLKPRLARNLCISTSARAFNSRSC